MPFISLYSIVQLQARLVVSVFFTQNLKELGSNPNTPIHATVLSNAPGLDCFLVILKRMFSWYVCWWDSPKDQVGKSTLNTNTFPIIVHWVSTKLFFILLNIC